MKKILLATTLTALTFGCIGFVMGKYSPIREQNRFNKTDNGKMVIVPSDTIEGRPSYSIMFSDDKVLDNIYAEEIGYGLMSGKWGYNEDILITEIPKVSLSEIDK